MWDRLNLLGAGGQWLNEYAAMRIGGLTDIEELYRAIELREFGISEAMLVDGDVRNPRSSIRIEAGSYVRWLDRRSQLPLAATKAKIEDMTWRLGMMQTEIGQITQAISRLVTLFEKLNKRPVGQITRRTGRLKKIGS